MFRYHREGRVSIFLVLLLAGLSNGALWYFLQPWSWLHIAAGVLGLLLLVFILQFFRNPKRPIAKLDNNLIYAPADGKIVVIEQTEENEFFKGPRLQISIFMSPLNVHVNRHPITGLVVYSRYHPGKYLAAWHPKSSTENERTTVVYQLADGRRLMLRQIAGALARRIVNYMEQGDHAVQGEDMGFIKLGSRVDLFLPLDAKVQVKIGDVVKGNQTIIATW